MTSRSLIAVALVILIAPSLCSAGVVFSVRPGFGIQTSHLGLQTGRLTPYIGLDILHLGATWRYDDIDWSLAYPQQTLYKSHEGHTELNGSATMFIPHVGAKLNLSSPQAQLRPYLLADLFKAISTFKFDGRDEDRYYDQNGNLTQTDIDEFDAGRGAEELVKGLLGIWGVTVGFGVEYPFSEHFTVGGEYGWRMIFSSGNGADTDTGGFEEYQWRQEWKEEISASLKMSYGVVTLNYYF